MNCACQLDSKLTPQDLLREFKRIENQIGREKSIRYGPRLIDVDIIFYDNLVMHDDKIDELGDLTIPHKLMHERDFVLAPLKDISPNFVHPVLKKSIIQLLDKIKDETSRVIQLSPEVIVPFNRGCQIMGILNCTPDSFSDGGKFNNIESAEKRVQEMIESNVDIIDVGGESSRPGAESISVEEEINRILPVIKIIREKSKKIPISVDTVKAEVAKICLENGANIINDISGGKFDSKMYEIVKEYGCPYIMMHMRGNPKTMDKMTEYKDLITEVGEDLNQLIQKATESGIPKFNLIADPGIGFAKTAKQNCELIKESKQLSKILDEIPLLYGPSRKRFIGEYTGRDVASERLMGTAACAAVSIMNGVQFIRVHDVKEIKDVAMMVNAIKECDIE